MTTETKPDAEVSPPEDTDEVDPRARHLRSCGKYVRRQIERLWHDRERSAVKGVMAHLRRSVNAEPGSVPEIWAWTIDDTLGNPHGDAATREECAVHMALCLYAVHQQSLGEPMDSSKVPFGAAVRRLAETRRGDSLAQETPVYRRFTAAATSTTLEEAATHVRSLIGQLNAEKIPCDHAALADDFFSLQFADHRVEVLRRWARDFDRIRVGDPASTSIPASTKE